MNMKRKGIISLAASMLLMLAMIPGTFAQPGPGKGNGNGWGPGAKGICSNIPNLTDEQSKQIADLRTDHLKKMTGLRNQLFEKQAHLRTLNTADTPDMKAINATVDEIGSLKTDMMKEREAHLQKIRGLLTADQRAVFDSSHMQGKRFGKGNGQGHGQGRGHGMGRGMGSGQNPCPYNNK